jgi:tRNA-dihydrouridine synthase B
VPVTLKIRTGWDRDNKNGVTIARIAEQAGIAALSVHGRTRADLYTGEAEYATIAAIREAVSLPLFANGDIDSPEKARAVLEATGADALMIGRAAQGRPWIFREIAHYLATGEHLAAPATPDVQRWLIEHLHDHYALYGEFTGVRSARKHIGWAVRSLPGGEAFRAAMNTLETAEAQLRAVATFFDELADRHPVLPAANDALSRRQA